MGNQFWAQFLRYCAERSNRGSIRLIDGIEAAWVNSALIINNATYLRTPAESDEELRARLSAACADAAPYGLPWALFLHSGCVSGCNVEGLVGEFGLAHYLEVEVMTGDVAGLNPPTRPAPSVSFRRVDSRAEARNALDTNMRAYGMPEIVTESVMETDAYFSRPDNEFGYVAYDGDVAVSTATVIAIDGWLYVALVATDPAHRQKGYAEAVMRHALSVASIELGITRTALDASAMGAPVYERMGYRFTGERWSMFVPAH